MYGKFHRRVISVAALHFVEGLNTDEISANYDLQLPWSGSLIVRAESIISLQNLDYEIWLFSSAVNLSIVPIEDKFVGMWQFAAPVVGPPASPGYTVTPAAGGGANPLFRYYTDGLAIAYEDMDFVLGVSKIPTLHCRLVNRSVAAKLPAGVLQGAGDLQVTFLVTEQGVQA